MNKRIRKLNLISKAQSTLGFNGQANDNCHKSKMMIFKRKMSQQMQNVLKRQIQAVEKNAQLKTFFEMLKSRIINEKLYCTMTQTQITQFFEEATTQIQNKIKLYEDIQKLKLLQNYPTNTKTTYSKSANMILKKWLIENQNNIYYFEAQHLQECICIFYLEYFNCFDQVCGLISQQVVELFI